MGAVLARPEPVTPSNPGIHALDPDAYHASPGVSCSLLKAFAREGGPARVRHGLRGKQTAAMSLGSLIHCAVLEPAELEARYAPADLGRWDTRTAAFKEAQAAAGARELVKRADWDNALAVRDAVAAHPVARELLGPGLLVERSLFWTDAETGLACRGRVDAYRPDWGVMADLKSADDASLSGVRKAVEKYRYDLQEAMYRAGYEAITGAAPDAFFFIFVESEAPNLIRVAELDPEDVECATAELRSLLARWAECERTGDWPGYAPSIERIRLSDWHRSRPLA